MSRKIAKVAVLGSGVMGAQIAGHLGNAGIPSLLFDVDQKLAEKGITKRVIQTCISQKMLQNIYLIIDNF